MKLIIAAFLALLSAPLLAEVLSWEPPLTREDGTPLDPATDLKEYRLKCGLKEYVIPATTADPEGMVVEKRDSLTGYGEHTCVMFAVDNEGLRSPPSNEVTVTWEKAKPSQPTNLLIIID